MLVEYFDLDIHPGIGGEAAGKFCASSDICRTCCQIIKRLIVGEIHHWDSSWMEE